MRRNTKEIEALVDECKAQGWASKRTTEGHWRLAPADKTKPVVHISDSGEPRAYLNAIRDLRRGGLVWPPPNGNSSAHPELEPTRGPTESAPIVVEGGPVPETSTRIVETAPKMETEDARLDRIYAELKEARDLAQLAIAAEEEAARDMKAAIERHRKAIAERQETIGALAAKKEAFTLAFDSTGRPSAA